MKTLIAVGLLFVSAFASAFGQAEVSPVVLGVTRGQTTMTNAVPSGTTESTLVGSGVDLRDWRNVSLQLEGTCIQGVNVGGNLTLTFARTASNLSPSLAVYDTANRFTWSVLA